MFDFSLIGVGVAISGLSFIVLVAIPLILVFWLLG